MATPTLTPIDVSDYAELVGKRVILTVPGDRDTLTEVEGLIEAANAAAVLIKPKGQTAFQLIDPATIVQCVFAPAVNKTIKVRSAKVVDLGKVRQHLVTAHGWTLSSVNDDLTEEQATEIHDKIDHAAEDLGHVHSGSDEKDDSDSDDSE